MKFLRKKKLIAAVIILALCAAAFFIGRSAKTPEADTQGVILENEYSRTAYLNIKGLDVTPESAQNIKIPEEFTGIYKKYSEIQSKAALPLKDNRGKEAVRYLYRVNGKENLYAELLMRENRLIAAAVLDYSSGDISPLS